MKKLAIIACIIIILSITIGVITSVTTNATISNDITIDQLNGGDEAYLLMQGYDQYRDIVYGASACVTVVAVAVLLLACYKFFINKHDN